MAEVDGKIEGVSKQLQGILTQAQARRGPDPNKVYTVNTSGSPVRGVPSAPVTIAEFSDFQCPFCSRVGPTLERVMQVYGDKVKIVWKHNQIGRASRRAR